MRSVVLASMLATVFAPALLAQETVFNVPSADVLERGKAYAELDFAYRQADASAAFTPRIALGVGHNVELGANLSGLNTPGIDQTTLSPTFKWKAYDTGKNGWAVLLGDNVSVPVQNRTYDAANYAYAELVKSLHRTRLTLGAYHFTRHAVAAAQRGGGQFAIEQTVNDRLTLAADWYTGDHALGYFTPGAVVKLTPKLTWYAAYQIGNRGLTRGNHQLLAELGYNFN